MKTRNACRPLVAHTMFSPGLAAAEFVRSLPKPETKPADLTKTAKRYPRVLDDPKLPRVLVIGDSISMNHHEAAKRSLKGIANFQRIEGNSSSTATGGANLDLWLGGWREKGFHWDVIQFNQAALEVMRQNPEIGIKNLASDKVLAGRRVAGLETLMKPAAK